MSNADRIDRLIHDAEHAEAGAEFAAMMVSMQPNNPEHKHYRDKLAEKARLLRERAALLEQGIEPIGPDPD